MPYCPKCGDEFQDRIKICPDCQVSLVDKLPVAPPSKGTEKHNDPLVYIVTAPNEAVAGMWQGILSEQGIRSLVKGADLKAAMYALPFNLQCEIFVLASAAEKAREILSPFLSENG